MTIEAMFRPPDFYNLAPGHGPGQQQQPLHEPSKVEHLDPLVNQLCRVCDEPAAGFHFGAFTCEGCKSFFGRTCNNQSVIAECKNSYRCVVDKKNRTSCKACRLRKCLMVGMSKSGSRYGRRSNWFKIHCLMQANSNKRPLSSPASAPLPPPPPPPASVASSLQESQLPPTLRWPLSPSLTRLSLPQLPASAPPPHHAPAPHKSLAVSASAFESYANLLKQAGEAKMTEAMKKCSSEAEEDGDMISVSRSPSPPPRHEASPGPSPLNVSSISDTSSKSSHSLGLLSAATEAAAEAKHASLLDINKNTGHVSAPPPATPPIFPFGLSPPQLPTLPHLYNPLTFASPLYRLSPLLAANSLFGNPLLMFGGHKTHLDILEEHRKLIEKFGIASAAMSKSSEESFEEKAVKVEDPIDLTFKTSDDDRCEDAEACDPV